MNAYELAEQLMTALATLENSAIMLRQLQKEKEQQTDRIAELEKLAQLNDEILKPMLINFIKKNTDIYKQTAFFNKYDEVRGIKEKTTPQTKPLSDEEMNKAFDYYCETDEGVLRFNYELRDEWKKEQLIRWKEAFRKAWD